MIKLNCSVMLFVIFGLFVKADPTVVAPAVKKNVEKKFLSADDAYSEYISLQESFLEAKASVKDAASLLVFKDKLARLARDMTILDSRIDMMVVITDAQMRSVAKQFLDKNDRFIEKRKVIDSIVLTKEVNDAVNKMERDWYRVFEPVSSKMEVLNRGTTFGKR